MSRRLLIAIIILIPALALIVWLVVAQLPRWTAPQPGWFSDATPGVCAAVESLKLYQAARADAGSGISSDTARSDASKVAADHYDASALAVSDPLTLQATLPGQNRQTVYLVTVGLSDNKAAVVYLDAANGNPLALITAIDDSATRCAFDVRAALVAAVKSPPVPLLIAYGLLVLIALTARWIWLRKGRHG